MTGLERRRAHRVTGAVPPPTAATERLACDAVVLTPDLPVVYRLLGRAPRRPRAAALVAQRVVLHAGRRPHLAGAGPPHDLLRRGLGVDLPRDHRRRPADERPVAAGHPAHRHRPGARARRAATCCSCSRRARTRHAGRIDWPRVGPRLPRRAAARAGAARLGRAGRRRSRSRGWSRPADWAADGHGRGHAVLRWPTPSPRPGRSGRATSCAGWTTPCSPAAARRPGVGDPAGADLRPARRGADHRRPAAGGEGPYSAADDPRASIDDDMTAQPSSPVDEPTTPERVPRRPPGCSRPRRSRPRPDRRRRRPARPVRRAAARPAADRARRARC